MYAVNATHFRQNFKETCDMIQGRESLIITRPNNKNIVLISETRFAELEKAERNADWLAMVNRNLDKIDRGEVTEHALIED